MTLPERCDVAIVGGGPAGSALAALLARAGGRPVLLEKDRFPRAKVCGEFLSMEAQGLLRRIGCLEAVQERAPAVIEHARFFSPSGQRVEFALGAGSLGLSRFALDETLFRHAQDSGATALEDAEVLKIVPDVGGTTLILSKGRALRAELVIAAGGRRLVPAAAKSAPLFVGYKRRHRFVSSADAADLDGCVEIYLFKDGYCGVNGVEDGAVNVCLLADDSWLASLPSPKWEAVAVEMGRLNPSLGKRLLSLRPDGDPLAVARISLSAPGPVSGSLLRVGDAAGMIAPLCGDGQAMALDSAILLAELMATTERADLPAAWTVAWQRRYRFRLRVGRGLQGLLLKPRASEAALAACALWPALPRFLLTATRGKKVV